MKNTMRLSIQKGDALAVLIVLILMCLSAFFFIPRNTPSPRCAEVYLNGKKIKTLDLSVDGIFSVSGEYTNMSLIQNGKIAIVESDCPGADCVHTGWVSSAGRSIVCLPNRVEVRITFFDEVDFVVR